MLQLHQRVCKWNLAASIQQIEAKLCSGFGEGSGTVTKPTTSQKKYMQNRWHCLFKLLKRSFLLQLFGLYILGLSFKGPSVIVRWLHVIQSTLTRMHASNCHDNIHYVLAWHKCMPREQVWIYRIVCPTKQNRRQRLTKVVVKLRTGKDEWKLNTTRDNGVSCAKKH